MQVNCNDIDNLNVCFIFLILFWTTIVGVEVVCEQIEVSTPGHRIDTTANGSKESLSHTYLCTHNSMLTNQKLGLYFF